MNAALDHLHKVILSPYTEDSPPVIIMFQELLEASIEQIRNTKWVQERFTYGRKEAKSLRVCNTHLASLSSVHPIWPQQVAKATDYPEEEVIYTWRCAGG
ncbi:hypothetical protein H107_02496 [Trichophyton rubrum CBS 202.88]|nr:hypothetical protein H100_02415 [Trichophyton rubrum MR850]EZG19156.1 hypothetical protein H107_02496 [Trichophyton rubrum CBS 202.88]